MRHAKAARPPLAPRARELELLHARCRASALWSDPAVPRARSSQAEAAFMIMLDDRDLEIHIAAIILAAPC
jgi:hypothetical protein